MSAEELPYFKFVAALIDSGIWARLSPAARALYPVLLRFSDRNFKPVYPGATLLLKLTGFKQKSSLRAARHELVRLGLISLTTGSGRKNTCYHFRFDFEGVASASPRRHPGAPLGGEPTPLSGARGAQSGEAPAAAPYNQIHISINNNVPEPAGDEAERRRSLADRFGIEAVRLAESECQLSGQPVTAANLESVLGAGARPAGDWPSLESTLARKISPGSLDLVRQAFIAEREGLLIFADRLPERLKALLERMSDRVFFEPAAALTGLTRRQFWESAGGDV